MTRLRFVLRSLLQAWRDPIATPSGSALGEAGLSDERLHAADDSLQEGFAHVDADITELKQTRDALRRSEFMFHTGHNHSPAMLHIKDGEGRRIRVYKEAEKLSGVNDGDSRGKTSYDQNGLNGAGFIGTDITDITEREKAAAMVKFQVAFAEQNPDPVLRLERDGTIAYANPSSAPLLRFWGCRAGDKTPREILDTAMRALDREIIQQAEFDTGEAVYALTFSPVMETHQVNICGMDITDRYRAEAALRASDERFHAVINSTPNAISIKDLKGRCLIANKNFHDWFGTDGEVLHGTEPPDRIDSENRVRVLAHDRMVAETGEDINEERRLLYADGVTRDVYVQKFPVRDADGDIVAIGTVVNDTTERRKAERASRRLIHAIEGLSETFALYDADDRLVMCNKEYLAFNARIPEATLPGVLFEDHIRALVDKGLIQEAIGREEEWVETRLHRFHNPGEPFEMVYKKNQILLVNDQRMSDGSTAIIGSDISPYKEAEAENTRLGRIIDRSLNEIFTFEAGSFRFTQVNQGALNNLGYSLAEMQAMTPIDIKPDFTRETFESLVRPLRDGTRDRVVFETVHERKDGTTYDTEIHLQMMQAEDPAVFVTIVQDITERKRAEASRRASEYTVRDIINNLNAGIITINEQGIIETFNPGAEKIFGYAKAEIIGRNVSILMPRSDRGNHSRYLQNYFRTGHAKIIGRGRELDAQRKDGTEFPIFLSLAEMTATKWRLEERRRNPRHRFIGTVQDLTEKKQIEMALRRSHKMEAVGQLSGGLAHDFNNLLSIVIGNLDFLTRLTQDDPKLLEPVLSALNAALRGGRLTERMLGFSQQSQAAVKPTDVNKVLDGMGDIIAKSLTAQVTINVELTDDLWLSDIDPGELEDALLNLSLNAGDAMPQGGTFTIKTGNISLDEDYARLNPDVKPGDYVKISTSDTGTGIAADIVEKIFDPFFTTKDVGKGTGLGLSMVYGFAQRSKGHLDVTSEPGHGATFHLYLPRTRAQAHTQPVGAAAGEVPGGTESILVVDDEKELAAMTRINLENLGYTVFVAHDADEALDCLRNGSAIDLLFTDVVMPGERNGYDLAREAADLDPGLKVLMTSGFSRKPDGDEKLIKLFKDRVRKPYQHKILAEKIRRTLDVTE